MTRLSSVQTGIAGEYFVAAELSRRGFVASITLRNTRGIDILASNADATKSVGIQVKTCQGSRPDWMMNRKAEADLAENLFYVFVCLPAAGPPAPGATWRRTYGSHTRLGLRRLGGRGRHIGTRTCDASRIRKVDSRIVGTFSAWTIPRCLTSRCSRRRAYPSPERSKARARRRLKRNVRRTGLLRRDT
jgi:hypothetical protein